MKKTISLLATIVLLLSCTKVEDPTTSFDIELLYGSWRVTHILSGSYAVEPLKASIVTFNPSGAYFCTGEFGAGSGSFTTSGNTISVSLRDAGPLSYEVITVNGFNLELRIIEAGKTPPLTLRYEREPDAIWVK